MEAPNIEDLFGSDSKPMKAPVVVKWKPISVRLFIGGASFKRIGETLSIDPEEVSAWLTSPDGQLLIKEAEKEDDTSLESILRGQAIDQIMALIKVRDHGKSDAARVAAAKELQVHIDKLDPDANKTPDQMRDKFEQLVLAEAKKLQQQQSK